MEKEFVPYAEALALKELGFNEPCFFAFDNCSTPMRCSDLRTNEQKFDGVNYNSSTYTSQPTFSQAFRWFREKYGYDVSIKKCTPSEYKFEIEQLFVEDNNYYFIDFAFSSYKEAELKCLNKLIEIIKRKGL